MPMEKIRRYVFMKLNRMTTIIDLADSQPKLEHIDMVEQYLCDDEKQRMKVSMRALIGQMNIDNYKDLVLAEKIFCMGFYSAMFKNVAGVKEE